MSIWGYIFVAGIGWGVWSTIPSDNCIRVHRLAGPVRGAGTLIAYAIKNWSDPQTNADMKVRVEAAGEASEQFIAQEFFGPELECRWGAEEETSSTVTHKPSKSVPQSPVVGG
ncbi:hypothetical protein [Ferrovum sp.]|jgi:hypothetical protein|uniref:hypothetical protein n=1 Tax=Ferrovum sp. TaxID=2609467 RepID=UPI0026322C56|nr:hypothetical protein [Ferrovum sp.]